MKRNIIKLLLIFFVLQLPIACNEDEFLTVPMNGVIADENFFTTPERVEFAVIGAYRSVGRWWYEMGVIFIGEFRANEIFKGGANPDDQPGLMQMMNFSLTSDNDWALQYWYDLYLGAFACQEVINNIDNANYGTNTTAKNQHLAEVRFLRGLMFFELAQAYGDVPLLTKRGNMADLQPRTPRHQVVEQVYADFEFAANHLPLTRPMPEQGRATKGAAQGMLARAALFFAHIHDNPVPHYEKARDNARAVIESGVYSLQGVDFASLFQSDGDFTSESVFEIAHVSAPGPWPNASGGTVIPTYMGARGLGGWGFLVPKTETLETFHHADPRKLLTFLSQGDTMAGSGRVASEIINLTGDNPTGLMCRKYYTKREDRIGNEFDKKYNVKKLRYAELKLIYAEALLLTNGDKQTIADQINDVRTRANNSSRIDPYAFTPTSRSIVVSEGTLSMVSATDNLMEAIKNERVFELFGEGLRFWDLIRWGEAEEKLAEFGFVKGIHELLPIPQRDIDIAGLKQNPGY